MKYLHIYLKQNKMIYSVEKDIFLNTFNTVNS